jgi:hypothetical protein
MENNHRECKEFYRNGAIDIVEYDKSIFRVIKYPLIFSYISYGRKKNSSDSFHRFGYSDSFFGVYLNLWTFHDISPYIVSALVASIPAAFLYVFRPSTGIGKTKSSNRIKEI